MDLDQYLLKKFYVQNWDFMRAEERHAISINKGGAPRNDIDASKISYVEQQVFYWRKANHIHKWFVDNVQEGKDDCGYYQFDRGKLKQLRDLCAQVLAGQAQPQDALPTQGGFFFGSVEYDARYMGDVQETKDMLDAELALPETEECYVYHSSW